VRKNPPRKRRVRTAANRNSPQVQPTATSNTAHPSILGSQSDARPTNGSILSYGRSPTDGSYAPGKNGGYSDDHNGSDGGHISRPAPSPFRRQSPPIVVGTYIYYRLPPGGGPAVLTTTDLGTFAYAEPTFEQRQMMQSGIRAIDPAGTFPTTKPFDASPPQAQRGASLTNYLPSLGDVKISSHIPFTTLDNALDYNMPSGSETRINSGGFYDLFNAGRPSDELLPPFSYSGVEEADLSNTSLPIPRSKYSQTRAGNSFSNIKPYGDDQFYYPGSERSSFINSAALPGPTPSGRFGSVGNGQQINLTFNRANPAREASYLAKAPEYTVQQSATGTNTMTRATEDLFAPTYSRFATTDPFTRTRKSATPEEYLPPVVNVTTEYVEDIDSPSTELYGSAMTTNKSQKMLNFGSRTKRGLGEELLGKDSSFDFMDYLNNPEKFGKGDNWDYEFSEGVNPLDENFFGI